MDNESRASNKAFNCVAYGNCMDSANGFILSQACGEILVSSWHMSALFRAEVLSAVDLLVSCPITSSTREELSRLKSAI
jgi:hypothetical protein